MKIRAVVILVDWQSALLCRSLLKRKKMLNPFPLLLYLLVLN